MREQRFQGRQVTVESKIAQAGREAAMIFALKGWEYYSGKSAHIPDHEELAATITQLLEGAASRNGESGSGRFVVRWNEDFDCYEIMLILTDLSSRELYEETGIDIMAKAGLTEES